MNRTFEPAKESEMKNIAFAAALLALALLVAACSTAPKAPAITLGAAPWKDGERLVYDIVDKNGNTLGTSEFSFARDGDAWLLTASDKAGQVDQTSVVRVDSATLLPLGKEKIIKRPGTDATLSITYGGGKVQIKALVNGKDQNVTIDAPAAAIENDQLLMTLRAMPFAEGYQGSLVNVVPDTASRVNTTVRVKGREKVRTPSGSVNAWRVELDFGQARQSAWYAVEAPYTMVQYDNGATRLVLKEAQP